MTDKLYNLLLQEFGDEFAEQLDTAVKGAVAYLHQELDGDPLFDQVTDEQLYLIVKTNYIRHVKSALKEAGK